MSAGRPERTGECGSSPLPVSRTCPGAWHRHEDVTLEGAVSSRRAGRVALGVAAVAGARRLGRRSGVSDAELGRVLPGDELIARPRHTIDRATTLPAPPEAVWPWLVQLGKERGGWYMPSWLEPLIVRRPETKAATGIVPELQHVGVGDEIPDYGPGEPVFRAERVDPPHALVYSSLR